MYLPSARANDCALACPSGLPGRLGIEFDVFLDDTEQIARLERLLLELKGRLGPDLALPPAAAATTGAGSDIVQALVALGYSEKEAASALKSLPADIGVSEGIKLALKALNR